MSGSEENPHKRARLETDSQPDLEISTDSNAEEGVSPGHEPPEAVFDPHYNAPDGDICIIRAEDTHFRIHRYLLSRDSLIFRDALTLPQTGEPHGASVAEPIVLHDKVEDFRTLCWALYALPTDLNAQLKPDANVDNLRILATIANKYQFLSIEDWAITAISHHCRQHNFIANLPLAQTPSYLEIAHICSSKELQDIVEEGIIKKIEEWSISWSGLIGPFEIYGSRRLKGMMHYRLLMWHDKDESTSQPNTCAVKAGVWSSKPESPPARLAYRGFFALTKWWQYFLSSEGAQTSLPRASTCSPDSHSRKCQLVWPARFKSFIANTEKISPNLDVLAKLTELQKLATEGPAQDLDTSVFSTTGNMTQNCVAEWGLHIGRLREQMVDTMADHFYGCLTTPDSTPATD